MFPQGQLYSISCPIVNADCGKLNLEFDQGSRFDWNNRYKQKQFPC
jgi:hypothetical protein